MNSVFLSGLRIQKIISTRLMYRNIVAVNAIFLAEEKLVLEIGIKQDFISNQLKGSLDIQENRLHLH